MEVPPPRNRSDEARLASTHWTTVRACAGEGGKAHVARATLCRDYWYPVYAYIKRQGRQDHDAEDLAQGFFEHILSRPWFERADRSKGRFRSFLLTSLDHFLRDCFAGQMAFKRGGRYQHVPLDMASAESRYAISISARISPVEAYEAEWAAELVDKAWNRLQAEYSRAGKQVQFNALRIFLTIHGKSTGYEPVAQALGMTVENIKVSVHRLRKRYGAILNEEVSRTVGKPEDVPEEMRHIRDALAERATVAA